MRQRDEFCARVITYHRRAWDRAGYPSIFAAEYSDYATQSQFNESVR